jgi:hypothetical protein
MTINNQRILNKIRNQKIQMIKTLRRHFIIFITMPFIMGLQPQAKIISNWIDSSGMPLKTTYGECIQSNFYSRSTAHIDCLSTNTSEFPPVSEKYPDFKGSVFEKQKTPPKQITY